MRRRILTTWLVCASSLAFSATLAAHEFPAERSCLVQVTPEGVQIMITFREPRSERVDLFVTRHDVNRDGRLSDAEAHLGHAEFLKYALRGLSFEVAGERPRGKEPRVKLEHTQDGALQMAALLEYDVPRLEDGATREVVMRVTETSPHPAITSAQGMEGLVVRGQGTTRPVDMKPGSSVRLKASWSKTPSKESP